MRPLPRLVPPRLAPWLAVATLWLLFELPSALAPNRVLFRLMRPTGDLFVLLALLWTFQRFGLPRALHRAVFVALAVLSVVRADRTAFFVASRSEPLLYDQVFLARHLYVLVTDLLDYRAGLAFVGVLAAAVALGFLARALLRRAAPLADPEQFPGAPAALGVVTVGLALGTALSPAGERHPWVQWMTPSLVRNVGESVRIYRAVRRGIADSPYASFDQVRLEKKPDFLLFFVESYGRVLADHPETRPAWASHLRAMEERLTQEGWHTASAFGTAPVSGGRSWLAVSSILWGTTVQYEAVFRQFVEGGDRVPALPRFFERQGYATVNLAPSDRARRGIEDRNNYGYRTYLRLTDLAYDGPSTGWGIVPDQYALGYAEEQVLSRVTAPLFLHFHMVSSHVPWRRVPEYVEDWHTWTARGPVDKRKNRSELTSRLKRYSRNSLRETFMGDFTAELQDAYARAVFYDFRVIEEYLASRPKDAIVVMMGDHQPPVVAPEADTFDVPIHLLARDPALLAEYLERGFTPGLVPSVDRPAAVKHAGLFSLFVRALARARGDGAPRYFPEGVELGG